VRSTRRQRWGALALGLTLAWSAVALAVPDELTTDLTVQMVYDGSDVVWRFQFDDPSPGFLHDGWVYRNGEWVRSNANPVIFDETRLTFLVDPGTVRGFANQGCYATCHSSVRFMDNAASQADIQAHPYYGGVLNRTDMRKYVPAAHEGPTWWDVDWTNVRSEESLAGLQDASVFLDLWHWRAARSHALGVSDDQYVLAYRNNDGGRTPYATNLDADTGGPAFMFDEGAVGFAALRWEDLESGRLTPDDTTALMPGTLTEFDPDHAWQEGDVLPRVYLREPLGGHADITTGGGWQDGAWDIELRRAMVPPDLTTDHAFEVGRTYNVGFTLHLDGTGGRWHYVSHPIQVGIGIAADVTAVEVDPGAPIDWSSVPSFTVPLFYPAMVSWDWIVSDQHPGAAEIRADTRSCMDCHGETALSTLKLSQASVAREIRSGETRVNWWLTMVASISLIVGGTVFFTRFGRPGGQ
jgi:hypothetical protein